MRIVLRLKNNNKKIQFYLNIAKFHIWHSCSCLIHLHTELIITSVKKEEL